MTIFIIVDKIPCKISGCISITFKNISLSGFKLRRSFFGGKAAADATGHKKKWIKLRIISKKITNFFLPLIDNCLKICETMLSKIEQQPVQIVVSGNKRRNVAQSQNLIGNIKELFFFTRKHSRHE